MKSVLIIFSLLLPAMAKEIDLTPQLTVHRGAINMVLIGNERRLAVYGFPPNQSPESGSLLLTHARRDVLPLEIAADWEVYAPRAEQTLLAEPERFWNAFVSARFHDYAQQSTKVVARSVPVDTWVEGEETLTVEGIRMRVLETPGYTRGAVSYLAEIDGKRIAFTGDLIYGNGQILDLVSFQDAIPGAKIRGYHGYGSRLALLLTSLRRVLDEKPDLMIPARGPIIHEPVEAVNRLIHRVERLYQNYLSTTALHWYFKEKRMVSTGERVLGRGAPIKLMPFAKVEDQPDWTLTHGTSRLLISESGEGFLLDCGAQAVIDQVDGWIEEGRLRGVEGLFVTHFHDDHTDFVEAARTHFQCPVYAVESYADIISNPSDYYLPAMTPHAVSSVTSLSDGETMRWHEFEFTFHHYPGQTHYHGALFAKRADDELLCFIGDSFSPSGIDDYCVQNRNLLHEDTGYLRCLQKLRSLSEPYGLINQHIPHVFRFTDEEMDYLETRYRERIAILRELFPWDDPNWGIDEQWARFHPYAVQCEPGTSTTLSLDVENHSPRDRTFTLRFRGEAGMAVSPDKATLTLPSRGSGGMKLSVRVPQEKGVYLLTADVVSDGPLHFQRWTEAMIVVE